MKEKIFALIQQFGPMLPVEIASKTNLDSFMANAYVSELIADGKVRASKDKIAQSHLYYIKGQEPRVQNRLIEINNQSKKTASTYAPSHVNVTPEVIAKRDAFAQRLKEIEHAEMQRQAQQPRPAPPSPQKPKEQHYPPSTPLRMSKPQFRSPEPKPSFEMRPSPSFEMKNIVDEPKKEDFIGKGMDWIRLEGLDIIEELSSKRNEVELLIKARTHFGMANFYVKIKQKKSITEADLIAVYAAAMEQRCHGVLLTNGQLAKSAEAFLEEKKGIIKVKQI
jgi:hypothetical protein